LFFYSSIYNNSQNDLLEKEISLMRGWQVFGGGEQTPDNDNQDGRIPTPSSLELAHWVLVCK